MKKLLPITLLLILFCSCKSMDKNDRTVRRQDFFNRFSKTQLYATQSWKMGENFLKLRKNKTFVYQSRVFGIVKSGYFAGEYTFQNDTLKLVFKNNHKPESLDSMTLVLTKRYDDVVLDYNSSFLYVIKNKLQH